MSLSWPEGDAKIFKYVVALPCPLESMPATVLGMLWFLIHVDDINT